MRTMIAAILLISYAAAANAHSGPDDGLVCKANQNGKLLMTTAKSNNGYKVEAPWRVVATRAIERGGARVIATLDHIIETDPITGKRQRTELPGAIEMTFSGANNSAALDHAASVWCATVSKALAARPTETVSRVAHNRVVM
jgi:hypothetical protein